MLGLAGETATEDSYFQLTFDPAAQMKGGDNLFAEDLQAMAVSQFELKYGNKTDSKDVLTPTNDGALYASLYPASSKKNRR